MKTLLTVIAILLFVCINVSAQPDTLFMRYSNEWNEDTTIYQTDTILFPSRLDRHYLIGTTKLPWTHNQMTAKNYGFDFDSITKSDCKASDEREVYSSPGVISSIINTDTSLIIDINIYDNCCYDFLCDIAVDKEGVLNLIYTGYGNYCGCNCCFGLVYHLSKTSYGEEKEINAIILNGDSKTMKKL